MRRLTHPPRPDRDTRFAAIGFEFATIDGRTYWDESAHYRFTSAQIDTLDDATATLEAMVREAVEVAFRDDWHVLLGINEAAWALAQRSWRRGEPSLYGRMDLRWDGTGPPQLLEYNADTPTALFEAAVVQWDWLRTAHPDADQFNRLHEALIETWPTLGLRGALHFACAEGSIEDHGTTEYLRDTAMQAGFETMFLPMHAIGWDGSRFRDLEERAIGTVFKLYPWEWLLAENFGPHAAAARWIEPAWRMLPANKGFLALLWALFPGHPNLLPAFLVPGRTGGPEIAKPFWGREGANIVAPSLVTPGPYVGQPRVFQEYSELPRFDGNYPVLGSWVIGGRPAGLGIREDATPITRDTSRFIPHCFEPGSNA